MADNESTQKTLLVALALCVVWSVVVSTAAVLMKPAQEYNKNLDRKRNILQAAGVLDPGVSVDDQFEKISTRMVDLRNGRFTDEVTVDNYDQRAAAKDPQLSVELSDSEDIAKISRRAHYAPVYLVENASGGVEKIILPIHGYGLWSTLYGFLALEADANTVVGLGFFEHGETPGLGGEVDNPRWKSSWPGKLVYRDGEVAIHLIKGAVTAGQPGTEHQIDGLSGATLTARGVTNLVQFWLGDQGFASFLTNLKRGDA